MAHSAQNDLIYDVGMHRGEDSEFYLEKGFRVVAIEALPELAAQAGDRLRSYIDAGRLTILNVAIAEQDGPITFYANPGCSVWGTAHSEWAERNMRLGQPSLSTTVKGVRFHSILEQHGIPYYLKIDIEGSDLLCVRALLDFETRPKYLSLESARTSWGELVREFDLLKELGYAKFKVVPQHTIHKQRCPSPALEGTYVPHSFEEGSSGLFGEEAPGKWLSREHALNRYRWIFAHYRLMGYQGENRMRRKIQEAATRLHVPASGWYDTHASM